MDGNKMYVDGELMSTLTKTTFTTPYTLYAMNRKSSEVPDYSRAFAGKLLWIDLRAPIDTNGNPHADMMFLPALDKSDVPCLLDVKASPPQPYYCNTTITAGPQTNIFYDISYISF